MIIPHQIGALKLDSGISCTIDKGYIALTLLPHLGL